MDLPSLYQQCGPSVHSDTIAAIVRVESGGNQLAINVNNGVLPRRPRDAGDAAALASSLISAGYSVDLGLMQINSRNLGRLGLTPAQAFDPCANIAAGTRILSENYTLASQSIGNSQQALRAALSAYNTGNFHRGFRNGYVSKVTGKRGTIPTINAISGAASPMLADSGVGGFYASYAALLAQ